MEAFFPAFGKSVRERLEDLATLLRGNRNRRVRIVLAVKTVLRGARGPIAPAVHWHKPRHCIARTRLRAWGASFTRSSIRSEDGCVNAELRPISQRLIRKGALIEETYLLFGNWRDQDSLDTNFDRVF